MPIFAGIVGLVIVVAVAVTVGTMVSVAGLIADEEDNDDEY